MNKFEKIKVEKLWVSSILFLFTSSALAFFAPVAKFIDFELYYKLASHLFIEIIHLGKREVGAADALTAQTVHSYFMPLAWRFDFNILAFFLIFANFRIHCFC